MKENEAQKITIPAVNEIPFERVEKWAKEYYRKAKAQVSRQRAKKIKEELPIEMAAYCEKMTFGKWRLFGPPAGRPAKESPLETVLECLEPYIKDSHWKQFKPKFTAQLKKPSFTAICNADYDPSMVKEVNERINQTLKEFALKGYDLHLEFVLHPQTAEYYSSPAMLEIRSGIWEHFGIKIDRSKLRQSPGPGRPRQMAMHFVLSVHSVRSI